MFGAVPAEAACSNNAPANNEVVNCSGANATGVIAAGSTGVQLNLLTGGSISPAAGSSISLGANADINLQTNTTTGNTAIASTFAILIGDSSQVTINGTIQSQGGITGQAGGFAGFSNATIILNATGQIITNGVGVTALSGRAGGNTYQIDGTIHDTGISGTGIAVGNNDNVTFGSTGNFTADAGDTSVAVSGTTSTGVQVTMAAGSNITVNGLGFLGAIALGGNAHVEIAGTVNSKGSAVANNSVILGGVSMNANSFVWLKQGGQILVASAPPPAGVNITAAPGIDTSTATSISNSTIIVDGLVQNARGNGISAHTGDNITIGATGQVIVTGGNSSAAAISAGPHTTTTDNLLTIDIAGRAENTGIGRGIFITATSNDATDTSLRANVTIQETGVLAVQNNIAYRQDDGFGGFPEVIDNLVVKGTVSRSTTGTVIDLNDGADKITIFPTARITGNILGGNDAAGAPETDTFVLDGVAGTTGTFDFNANHVTQFEAFKKEGAGKWVMTGSVSFLNTADINAGTLAVNGTLTVPVVTVGAGGTLGGTGTVVGAVTVNGTIAPGNSIGTLNITGPYVQANGSIYTPEVNTTTADLINVTGAATIQGGTTVSVVVTPGFYTLGKRYAILTASGGVTGQYTTLTDNGPFVDFQLSSDANNIFLDVIRSTISFQEVAQTRNQKAAASGLELLGPGTALFDAAIMLDAPNSLRALDLLSGEIHASITGTMLEESRFIRDAVIGRLRQSVGGPASIFAPQLATLNYAGSDGDAAALAFDDDAMAYAPRKRKRVRDTMDRALPVKAPPATTGYVLTAWGQTFGNWGRTKGDGNAAEFGRTTGGFFTGMDATFAGSSDGLWRVGFAGGYQRTSVDVGDRNSSGSIDSYYVAAYGGSQRGPLGVRVGTSYGWHDVSTSRSIAFPGFSDAARANYGANTAQVFGEIGYGLSYRQFALEPFASLAYVNVRTDSFGETGGGAALTGFGGSTDATFSTMGLRGAAPLPWRGLTGLTAKGSLGWRHAYGTVTPTAQLALTSGTTSFVVAGVPIARDAATVELGLAGQVARNATLGVAYTGQIANSADDHGVNASYVQRF